LNWDSYFDASECDVQLKLWDKVLTAPFDRVLFTDYVPEVFVYSDASAVAGAAFIQHDGSVSQKCGQRRRNVRVQLLES